MKPVYRRWILIPALIIVPIAVVFAVLFLRSPPPKKEPENLDPLVEIQRLESRPERFRIHSQGTVRPRTRTVLSAEISGSIVSISPKFIPGGVFAKDEVLMRIDPTNYTVAVEQADALVRQRQIEFDGAEKLRTKGYRAESEYASAAAALATARAELVRARRNLERTYIRLPYEGMVLSKDADLGQFVNPGTPLGVTFATDVAEVRLPLTDQDLAFVRLPAATAVSDSGAAEGPQVELSAVQKGRPVEWSARVVRSEGVVDERSRVTYAVARIDDPYRLHSPGPALPIGTFVSASIIARDTVDVIRVPRGAIRGADELIFVGDDNRIEIRSVDILRTDAQYAYLQSGAEDGERISLTTIEAPSNGMMVRASDDIPDDAPEKEEGAEKLISGADGD
jgi:RND family efflux transporter MFP subunit